MPQPMPQFSSCPGCGERSGGPRCARCGVALAPGGLVVQRVLSQNEHGRVYLARDPQGQPIAVKELVYAATPGATEVEQFQREATVLQQLSHPQVPRFLGSFAEGEGAALRLYLVQSFVDGRSLQDRLTSGPFPEPVVLRLARQVLEILRYLHGLQPRVLHRDIKPANLIQGTDGKLWLVDFGAVRLLENSETLQGTFAGTVGYMPLEALGGTVDETTDLYALGATLLHLATGREPSVFLGPDRQLRLPPELPPKLRALIGHLVAPRGRRFASAGAALQSLDRGDTRGPSTPSQGRARLVLQIVAVLAAFAGSYVLVDRVLRRAASASIASASADPVDSSATAPPADTESPVSENPNKPPELVIDSNEPIELPKEILLARERGTGYAVRDTLRFTGAMDKAGLVGPVHLMSYPAQMGARPTMSCVAFEELKFTMLDFSRSVGDRLPDGRFEVLGTLVVEVRPGASLPAPASCDDGWDFVADDGFRVSPPNPIVVGESFTLRFAHLKAATPQINVLMRQRGKTQVTLNVDLAHQTYSIVVAQ